MTQRWRHRILSPGLIVSLAATVTPTSVPPDPFDYPTHIRLVLRRAA